jgi:hypothetical protein
VGLDGALGCDGDDGVDVDASTPPLDEPDGLLPLSPVCALSRLVGDSPEEQAATTSDAARAVNGHARRRSIMPVTRARRVPVRSSAKDLTGDRRIPAGRPEAMERA